MKVYFGNNNEKIKCMRPLVQSICGYHFGCWKELLGTVDGDGPGRPNTRSLHLLPYTVRESVAHYLLYYQYKSGPCPRLSGVQASYFFTIESIHVHPGKAEKIVAPG